MENQTHQKKILIIVGTRPEAIKLAPIVHALERMPDVEPILLTTGQHLEMLRPMLDLFGLSPAYDLAVMRPGQGLSEVTARVLEGLSPVVDQLKPDWMVVQGDTTTVMAASLVAFFHKTPLAHVEAGLRTFDKYSPFPEEMNRRMASLVADLHFAPTAWAVDNLRREGVPSDRIRLTGNTVVDSLFHVQATDFDVTSSALECVPPDRRWVLVTAHRQESFGPGMERIARGLARLAVRHEDTQLIFPVHMNPKAREPAVRHLSEIDNVSLLDPLGYRELIYALSNAHLVITDSGGLQEEAAALGKPVLVLRDTTERPEGVHAGIAKLIGASSEAIVREAGALLANDGAYRTMAETPCPYGDGKAAGRIAKALAGHDAPPLADYEHPALQHPFDALLRQVTEEIPRRYAKKVIRRGREAVRPQDLVRP